MVAPGDGQMPAEETPSREPASSAGNFTRPAPLPEKQRTGWPRKKSEKADNISVADFIAPKSLGIADYIGGFVVTTGLGIEKKITEFEADHDDYHSILLKAIADRLAEAFAALAE